MTKASDNAEFDVNEARKFLDALWGLYTGPLYYEVFIIGDDGSKYVKFFNKVEDAMEWLARSWNRLKLHEKHVYYGILPRFRKPEKGRGSANDVDRGLWLWSDLDYKKSFDKIEDIPLPEEAKKIVKEEGYWFEEKEDYALIGVYRSGNKWVYVERPPLSKVKEEIREKVGIEPTIIVDSGAGYHVYFKLSYEVDSVKLAKIEEKLVDILGADPQSKDLARVLRLPGSINPRLNRLVKVIETKPIEIDPEELDKKLEDQYTRLQVAIRAKRKLSEEQIKKLVKIIEPYYVPGHRNNIVYPLIGLLIKAGIDYDSTRRIIELLATETKDEEIKHRLYLVDYHYGRRVEVKGIEKLKGITGIREELEKVLREQGLPEDEIVKRVSETVAELYSVLGLSRGPGVAWLERKGGFIKKWVAVGRQGIYVFKRRDIDDEPTVQIVSNAIIKRARAIRVLGLDLRNLYMVNIDGEEVSGTIDEIVSYIEKHYGLERGARYAIARLIEYTSEEEEELFYSPGPWVVDGKIVFAREPGYTPPWKPYIIWKLPEEDVSEELKKKALECIKNLVLAYRDPSKPSLVLSYAAIAPIMHYVKKVLNLAPHLIIHGLEGTGKSLLLELIKLLYNITWEDPYPGSDYQARRCLAASTLPAIIDEIGGLIEGYNQGKRDSIEAINILHRAATQEMLRVSGGYTYGGYFLAVRTIIAATNSDVTLVPWQLDKFILVTISIREHIDVSKAKGYTPRTMETEVKAALPRIGLELLEEVEKLLGDFEELRKLPRDEIRVKLIELGYKAWCNLYKKYGLEPFPGPGNIELELEKASLKEQYEDIFLSFLRQAGERFRDITVMEVSKSSIELPTTLEEFEKNLAIIVVDEESGKRELVCKTAFLSRFMEWASKEFGIPKMGWKRLSEILGMTRTRKKIGNKVINHVLIKELT